MPSASAIKYPLRPIPAKSKSVIAPDALIVVIVTTISLSTSVPPSNPPLIVTVDSLVNSFPPFATVT